MNGRKEPNQQEKTRFIPLGHYRYFRLPVFIGFFKEAHSLLDETVISPLSVSMILLFFFCSYCEQY
jgi:hypothetical protein